MKNRCIILIIISFLLSSTCYGQGTWTQKADFGGEGREFAVGFSIGNKGYIGTGYVKNNFVKDFWEYDPSTNTWTQKADFGGLPRTYAVGFSIGSKGYIGCGQNSWDYPPAFCSDFWEYDPLSNIWIQKANFGGGNRCLSIGFSIGDKGYIGTGVIYDIYRSMSYYFNDFWEYDPSTNIWSQKAYFCGIERFMAVGFSIGNKGYIGTGSDSLNIYNDFWEYNPEANLWTKKASFGGGIRSNAVGFSIGNKGYIGAGVKGFYPDALYFNDFWEYDPNTNLWTKKADFCENSRFAAFCFSIGNNGYIGAGVNGFYPDALYFKDFWEYDPNGISDVKETPVASFKVSPNPANNYISIEYQIKVAGNTELLLVNSQGEVVKQISCKESINSDTKIEAINLDGLSSGEYILILKTPTGSESQKVVIIK